MSCLLVGKSRSSNCRMFHGFRIGPSWTGGLQNRTVKARQRYQAVIAQCQAFPSVQRLRAWAPDLWLFKSLVCLKGYAPNLWKEEAMTEIFGRKHQKYSCCVNHPTLKMWSRRGISARPPPPDQRERRMGLSVDAIWLSNLIRTHFFETALSFSKILHWWKYTSS